MRIKSLSLFAFLIAIAPPAVSFAQGWFRQTSGTSNSLFGVCFSDSSVGVAVGDGGTILRTTNAGLTWNPHASGVTNRFTSVVYPTTNVWIAVGVNGQMARSSDNGVTWSLQSSGVARILYGVAFANADTGIAVGGDQNNANPVIVATTNGGDSWFSPGFVPRYSHRAAYLLRSGVGFAIGIEGTLLRTTDFGAGWTDMSPNIVENLLAISFWDDYRGLIVGSSGLLLRTSNAGLTWQRSQLSTGIHFWGVSCYGTQNATAVGSNGTITRTSDGGSTWSSQPSGAGNKLLAEIHFSDARNGTAVGDSGLILRTTSGGVVSVRNDQLSHRSVNFALRQNYPNPFNPETKIKFQIPTGSDVSLKVFDVLGREVKTLVSERLQPGSYETTFDGSGLASGVYLYRLQAGGFVETKKLVLLR
jgi:photosystem II stability/assembly factor-like uncharacterized protein